MAVRKRGVTFLICFRKRGYPEKGGFLRKRGVPTLEETILIHVVFCWYLDLISHTHKQRQRTHSGVCRLANPYNIFLHQLLHTHQQLSLLHWMNNSLISKFTFCNSFLFKNYSLAKVIYLLIICNKTRFFLWNTNNTDRNGVNKQTHTQRQQTPSER